MLDGVFVRMLSGMPLSVRGVTMPNPDGTYSIYVNADLPPQAQQAALEHELCHVRRGHLDDLAPVAVNELEANGKPVPPAAPLVPPPPLPPAQPKKPAPTPPLPGEMDGLLCDLRLAAAEDRWLFDVG